MKTFENLDIEKQDQIINSAMRIFAVHGYKKAYMSEIAKLANVSKPALFYHFGTKLELYFYVLDIAFGEITESVDIDSIAVNRDFFECLQISTERKLLALKKRPSLMKFLTKFYFETAEEIEERKAEYLEHSQAIRNRLVFEDLDVSKFKDSVDPQQVMNMLLKWNEGNIAIAEKRLASASESELEEFYDGVVAEFLELIEMLRTNFYLPQYL